MNHRIQQIMTLTVCGWMLHATSTHARDLLILANHELMLKTAAEGVANKFEERTYTPEDFEIVMVTYQYVPTKVMNKELVEVVIDQKKPIKEEMEKFGDIQKLATTKRRFVVIMGTKGYVKQITEKTAKSYKVIDG